MDIMCMRGACCNSCIYMYAQINHCINVFSGMRLCIRCKICISCDLTPELNPGHCGWNDSQSC